MNAFLALSVEKLIEIRDLEEDQSKEQESEEKERKQREDQLTALKHPKFEIRRRTIRRLIRFQANNPKERVTASVQPPPGGGSGGGGGEKQKWWKQFSLPHFSKEAIVEASSQLPTTAATPTNRMYRRSVSTPSESVTSPTRFAYEGEELGIIEEGVESTPSLDGVEEGGVARKVGRPVMMKKKNPLSDIPSHPSCSEIKIQEEEAGWSGVDRGSGLTHQNVVPSTAHASRLARIQRRQQQSPPPLLPPVIPEEEEEEGGAVFSPPPPLGDDQRQMSIVSAPGMMMDMVGGEVGGMRAIRSYSLPLGYSTASTYRKVRGCGL